jgi:hypothetical protein
MIIGYCSFISSGHRNIRCFSCCSVTVHRNIRCFPFSITSSSLGSVACLSPVSSVRLRFLCSQIGNSLSLHSLRRSWWTIQLRFLSSIWKRTLFIQLRVKVLSMVSWASSIVHFLLLNPTYIQHPLHNMPYMKPEDRNPFSAVAYLILGCL